MKSENDAELSNELMTGISQLVTALTLKKQKSTEMTLKHSLASSFLKDVKILRQESVLSQAAIQVLMH